MQNWSILQLKMDERFYMAIYVLYSGAGGGEVGVETDRILHRVISTVTSYIFRQSFSVQQGFTGNDTSAELTLLQASPLVAGQSKQDSIVAVTELIVLDT